ncbi:GNAT family N-acetyltransferase [Clostridium sulfidigenes]|uniref:GNAT family N-acetyltransferase n=1 Tax=Clostridium sulfidigenes TaxID=318464 RepID=UPI002418ADC8|nr:GNAT family N-acetyltransferase [Clostridium sulfidigenes]
MTTGEFIGCCGVRPFKSKQHSYEIGFHLRKRYWGQGYAHEAAKTVINYCFSKLNADKLFAGHHPQNVGSKKLLVRLGFEYIGDNFYEPTGLYLWNLETEKWVSILEKYFHIYLKKDIYYNQHEQYNRLFLLVNK